MREAGQRLTSFVRRSWWEHLRRKNRVATSEHFQQIAEVAGSAGRRSRAAHAHRVTGDSHYGRVEHEFRCFKSRPLGDDQILVAGVIDSLTNLVEHPEVVADRIERVAAVIMIGDPSRVLASTDCGFDTSAGWGRVADDVVSGQNWWACEMEWRSPRNFSAGRRNRGLARAGSAEACRGARRRSFGSERPG